MNVEELMGLEFDEGGEREYRRGYLDGMLAALDYAAEGKDIGWLYRFRDFVVEPWACDDCGRLVEPPLPGHYLETDEGWVKL